MRFGRINTLWDVMERYYERKDIALLDDIDDVSKGIELLQDYKQELIHSGQFDEMKYIEIQEVYEDYLIQKQFLTSRKLLELSNISFRLNDDLKKLRGDYSYHLGLMEKTVTEGEKLEKEFKKAIAINKQLSLELLLLKEKEANKTCLLDKLKKFFFRS